MAAVTVGTLHPCAPPAYEVNDKGQAAVAITKGNLLVITNATPGSGFRRVWDKAPTTTTDAHGIALMDAAAGGTVSVGIQGEMAGYSGLVPGNPLYPSASVAGGIDTSKPAGALERIRAIDAETIRFSFV